MQNRCILGGLEAGQDLPLLEVSFGEDQSVGLVAVRGYYYVVIKFGLAVLEMHADSSVVVIREGFDGSGEKDVVGGEPFHYGVDIALGAVFEG
jgi:hypothetical protein